jgi:hypothetical protein
LARKGEATHYQEGCPLKDLGASGFIMPVLIL